MVLRGPDPGASRLPVESRADGGGAAGFTGGFEAVDPGAALEGGAALPPAGAEEGILLNSGSSAICACASARASARSASYSRRSAVAVNPHGPQVFVHLIESEVQLRARLDDPGAPLLRQPAALLEQVRRRERLQPGLARMPQLLFAFGLLRVGGGELDLRRPGDLLRARLE